MATLNQAQARTKTSTLVGTKAGLIAATDVIGKNQFISASDEPELFGKGNGTDASADFAYQGAQKRAWKLNAVNVTGGISTAALKNGVITSTSAAAVTATLPTGALAGVALNAKQGFQHDFVVDNSAGAAVVTVAVAAGITVAAVIVTGDNNGTLTVGIGVVGFFGLYFVSATVAILYRVG